MNPYVTSSPGQAFPMASSPSYNVVAGSCGSESAPDGGTVDGQPVTLTAGGSTSVTINLVPVQIFVNYNGSLVNAASLTASVSNAAGTGTDTNCPTSGTGVMPTLQLGSTTATWSSFRKGHHHRRASQSHRAILLASCSSNCATTTSKPTSTLNPSTAGASVTFSVTVTCTTTCASSPGSPSAGTVQFKDNGTAIGSAVTISSGGVATYTTAALAVGTQSITAVYSGSGTKWATSTSSALSQVVNTVTTTTTLSANPNPNAYGTSVLLTAAVTCTSSGCGTPTGTVTFTKAGTNITGCVSVTVTAGSATCTLSGLAGGSYTVAATYTPTTNYTTSTSSLTQVVTAASTTTALTSSANPSTFNSSVTLTATVTPASGAPAVGSVAFMDGTTTLATVTLNSSGVATTSTSTLALGSHSLSAVFTPTTPANFGASTGTLTQVVNAPTGTPYFLCGLPYGVWHLSATYVVGANTYKSSNESTQIVVEVTPSGFYVGSGGTFGSLLPAGSSVTVYVK